MNNLLSLLARVRAEDFRREAQSARDRAASRDAGRDPTRTFGSRARRRALSTGVAAVARRDSQPERQRWTYPDHRVAGLGRSSAEATAQDREVSARDRSSILGHEHSWPAAQSQRGEAVTSGTYPVQLSHSSPVTATGRVRDSARATFLIGLAGVGALVAVTAPFMSRYGWDRDELYFLSAAHHLAPRVRRLSTADRRRRLARRQGRAGLAALPCAWSALPQARRR